MTKTKQKRDNVLTKRNETLINRDDINAKCKKVINLFNETMTNETNAKKNNDAEFKSKEKKMISFEIITTANEEDVMIKRKISIENNDFYMFEVFDVKNSTERISTKHHIDDITSISNLFKTSTFDVKVFSK